MANFSSTHDRVVLVKRENCIFAEKDIVVSKCNISVVLICNDGTWPDRINCIYTSLGQVNELTLLPLACNLSQKFDNVTQDLLKSVSIRIQIVVTDGSNYPPGSIGIDILMGDVTQSTGVGSHNDRLLASI